jgi:hypothetical protein
VLRADGIGHEFLGLGDQATASYGVVSTLTLPILTDDEVTGTVNLYASAPTRSAGTTKISLTSSQPGLRVLSPTPTCPSAPARSPLARPTSCGRPLGSTPWSD